MTGINDSKQDMNLTESPQRHSQEVKSNIRAEERAKEPTTLALDRCDNLIEWYEKNAKRERQTRDRFRITAIVLAGLTPVLVVVQMAVIKVPVLQSVMNILIALFPGVAAIISAIEGMFQWKDNYIRFSRTAEELKSEKVKYLTRGTKRYHRDLSEYEAMVNFITKVEAITMEETKSWRSVIQQSQEIDELIKIARQKPVNPIATIPEK